MESTDLSQKGKPVVNITDKQMTISGITGGLLLAIIFSVLENHPSGELFV